DDAVAMLQIRELQQLLRPHRGGGCEVSVDYRVDDALARIAFGPTWRIKVNRAVRDGLEDMFGTKALKIAFAPER
ncbi:MAG: hypothetical protein AAF270_08540, partial [Pseudomonadota bacterium]